MCIRDIHTYELYPQIVIEQDLGGTGPTGAQLGLVSNAAIDACDVVNGRHLGYIPDPLQCRYDPTLDASALCVADGGSNTTASCVSTAQARAINKIWYGQTRDGSVPAPADDLGTAETLATNQQYFGLSRGTTLALLAGDAMSPPFFGPFFVAADQAALSLQDPRIATPSFTNATGNGADLWKDLTYADLARSGDRGVQLQSAFANVNSDDPNLSAFKARNGKLLAYHGTADVLVPAPGSINYYTRVAAEMGGIASIQGFYRYYLVPGMSHGFSNGTTNPSANPPLPTIDQLYDALTNWVEKGVKPDHLVAQVSATRTRKVCMYPNTPRYVGTGSTDDEANFVCQFHANDDPALLQQEAGLLKGNGPLRGNHDIDKARLKRGMGRHD